MPDRCVVAGCNNTRSVEECIFLHVLPLYGDDRKEAKRRRKRWLDFVEQKRAQVDSVTADDLIYATLCKFRRRRRKETDGYNKLMVEEG